MDVRRCLCMYVPLFLLSGFIKRRGYSIYFFLFTQRYCQPIFKDRTGGQRVAVDVREERVKKHQEKRSKCTRLLCLTVAAGGLLS